MVVAELIIDSGRVKVFTEIGQWVFCFSFTKPQDIIKLSNGELETPTLEMVGEEVWGVEVELNQFVKLKGGVKLPDQLYIGGYIHSKEVGPTNSID